MNYYGIAMKFLLPAIFPAILFAQERTTLSTLSAPVTRPKPDTSEETNMLRDREHWIENVSERTVYSSNFTTADGRVITHYSKLPLNYYDASGTLQKIVVQPKADANGWSALEQPFPTYLFSDGSAAVSPSKEAKFVFGKNISVNGNLIPARVPVMNGNMAKIANIIPGMNKEYGFKLNGVKYNYVLNQPVATVGGFLNISEELEIPSGYFLKRSEERGREQDGGWCGDYLLISPIGEVAATIYAPICFDASKKIIIGTYKLKNENGHQFLELLVPATWLNDASRTYPITIDPLIIGPTALYGPATMPSCFAPADYSDSILVTIPAAIAITGLIVTDSYYADPFAPAIMTQGSLWITTPCGTTIHYSVASPQGDTAGTGIMDTFNLRSPLTCCYPQSCSQRTFYLTSHISRTVGGAGCNLTYVRYDPAFAFPSYPFEAYVEGRTVESYATQWLVQIAPICSNVCTFTGNIFMRYGVPPYTITHPWMTTPVIVGTPAGCSFSPINKQITLTRPICPTYCDTITLLEVPPPTVTDACGNTISGLPMGYLHLKSTPIITAAPNPDSICSGTPMNIILTSCLPNSTTQWIGNNTSGSGNINDTIYNTGNTATTTNYIAVAIKNGCASDSITIPVVVDPSPIANFTYSIPAITGVPVGFTNTTPIYVGAGNNFFWDFADASFSVLENPTHTYANAGIYHVCFAIATNLGCQDTICQDVTVIPAVVVGPNIITPNADGVNDLLVFKYLEYYLNNHLDIYDRWGMLLYTKDSYQNNWDGSKYVDGTYYYVLTTKDNGKQISGFFQIIK